MADLGIFLRAHHWVRNPRISIVFSDHGALCGTHLITMRAAVEKQCSDLRLEVVVLY